MAISMPSIVQQLMPGHVGRGRAGFKPQIITIHTQGGTGNPFGWFKSLGDSGPNAADCTIWNPAADDGQLVRYLNDTDTCWTNGLWKEPINHSNPVLQDLWQRGIYSGDVALTVENEGYSTLTAAQLERLAWLCAWWCQQCNIPADRNHIVGHYEIGPHKFCPGFALEPVVARVQQILGLNGNNSGGGTGIASSGGGAVNGNYPKWLANGFEVNDEYGFLSYHQAKGGVEIFGLPISGAYFDPGQGRVVQWFERARFERHDEATDAKYKVQLGLLGVELLPKTH